MKRSLVILSLLVLALLLTTAGVTAKEDVIRDNAKVEINTQIGKKCPVMLTGSMHVRTDLIKPDTIFRFMLFEQHVNMQGVDGFQVGGRTFQLVGADQAEGKAVQVIEMCKEKPCPPPVYHVYSTTRFTLVEQGTQAQFPVVLDMRTEFTGDEVTYRSIRFFAEELCP